MHIDFSDGKFDNKITIYLPCLTSLFAPLAAISNELINYSKLASIDM